MTEVRHREVLGKDGCGIAEDYEVIGVQEPILFPREVFDTQKTRSPFDGLCIDGSRRACHTAGIELECDIEAVASDLPLPN